MSSSIDVLKRSSLVTSPKIITRSINEGRDRRSLVNSILESLELQRSDEKWTGNLVFVDTVRGCKTFRFLLGLEMTLRGKNLRSATHTLESSSHAHSTLFPSSFKLANLGVDIILVEDITRTLCHPETIDQIKQELGDRKPVVLSGSRNSRQVRSLKRGLSDMKIVTQPLALQESEIANGLRLLLKDTAIGLSRRTVEKLIECSGGFPCLLDAFILRILRTRNEDILGSDSHVLVNADLSNVMPSVRSVFNPDALPDQKRIFLSVILEPWFRIIDENLSNLEKTLIAKILDGQDVTIFAHRLEVLQQLGMLSIDDSGIHLPKPVRLYAAHCISSNNTLLV